jgi:hypothetical protein
MNRTLTTGLLAKIGCITWASWVLLDYAAHHPYLTKAIATPAYPGLLAFFAVLAVAGGLFVWQKSKAAPLTLSYRGIYGFIGVQAFAAAILIAFDAAGYMPDVSVVTRTGYFFGYSSLHLLGLFALVVAAYAAGSFFLQPLKERLTDAFTIVAIALGLAVLGLLLTILGLVYLLKFAVVLPLLIGLVALRWRASLDFLRDSLWTKRPLTLGYWWTPAVLIGLGAVLGFNLIAAFKTFPIGYDGSALYVNLASLIASSGELPYGGQAFGWSVLMALGKVLFGSLTMTILITHLMTIPLLIVAYRLARTWLGPDLSLVAILVAASSPYLAFHGITDEKTDLAFGFIALSSFLLGARSLVQGMEGKEQGEDRLSLLGGRWHPSPETYALLLVGFLAGFAFTIKYLALLYLIALGCWLFYRDGGFKAYAGGLLAALGLVFLGGIYRFGYVELTSSQAFGLGGVLLLGGLGMLVLAYRRDLKTVLRPILQLSLVVGLFFVAFAPWAVKHTSEHGSFGVSQLLEGRAVTPELRFLPSFSDAGTPQFHFGYYEPHRFDERMWFTAETQQRGGVNSIDQSAREEIQRYLGYEAWFWRYFSVPYDLTMNTNIAGARYLDVGYLGWLFLPLLLLTFHRTRGRALMIGIGGTILLLLYLAGAWYSVYAEPGLAFDPREVMSRLTNGFASHAGGNTSWFFSLYISLLTPILALADGLSLPFALLGELTLWATILLMIGAVYGVYRLLKSRLATAPRDFRAFGGFLAAYGLAWWLLGNGIVWYAMPLFVLFPVAMLWFFDQPDRFLGAEAARFSSWFGGVVLALLLVGNVAVYFTSSFPEDQTADTLFRWPFVDVASNPAADAAAAIDRFNPAVRQAMTAINADPAARVYRVNTHYGFFIDNNDLRVFSDPTLERYDEISGRLSDNALFFDMLKAQGFKFIFFDLKTGMQDTTPDKSLQKKFVSIAEALTTSDKVRVVTTDNYISDPAAPQVRLPNGQFANARQGLRGNTVHLGNIALFEIR